ncbi:Rho GTPase activation protein [Dipodascopsis uninucleata]
MSDLRSSQSDNYNYSSYGSTESNSSSNTSSNNMCNPKRSPITEIYIAMSESDQDYEIDDELARAQKRLRDLKTRITFQSKQNFLLERDVRYLDSRIALLIHNKIATEEQAEVQNHLEHDPVAEGVLPDYKQTQKYGNLFFLLQTQPRYIASLCRKLSMQEIDSFLQTVMFTIYGNQYDQREEHLLLSMFQSVLSSQFDTTTEFSSLLRANTAVSRMMTTYTRRGPGQSYLKAALSPTIKEIIAKNELDLEINALKVYEQIYNDAIRKAGVNANLLEMQRSVTMDQALSNKTVHAVLQPRIVYISNFANKLLSSIIESLESVPYGIRWICKQIRSLTRRKYPDVTDADTCSLIGAFFFLRYINPCIVSPHSYLLVDKVPDEHPRRTLTYIAKMLQNLSNMPTSRKEQDMPFLTAFIKDNKARMNKFLNDLCEVSDFYETLEIDRYVALSKKDIILSITVNEMYGMHALLAKYRSDVCPENQGKLTIILDDLGTPPPLFLRHENFNMQLSLFNRFESGSDSMDETLDINEKDLVYLEAKTLLVQILRSFPLDSPVFERPLNLYKIAIAAAHTTRDAVVLKKGQRVLELLRILEDEDRVNLNETGNPLADEVEGEICRVGSIREKVLEELISLESVYRNICDHNKYLHGQLETYKNYLRNVRIQSGPKKSNMNDRVGLVAVHGKDIKSAYKSQNLGPYRFSQQVLRKEGVIIVCNVPEARLQNLYFLMASPTPGTFIVSLHYKGRSKSLLELNLKLDDLLEMANNEVEVLDLEYVILRVSGMLEFLQRQFSGRRR